MSPLRSLKNLSKRLLHARGYEIYKRPYLPKGADAFLSLSAHWPQWQPEIVFDVGANVGQTVARLRPLFPRARIFSFEPVPASFAELVRQTAADSLVSPQPVALAEHPGEAVMQVAASSDQSSLHPALRTPGGAAAGEALVTLDTVAAFCERHALDRIGLLKIDVEGFELQVLRGATPLLAAGAVDFIVAEAGLTPGSSRFTPLADLAAFLQPHGFHLVGVYEQFGWRFRQTAEFCNAAFAHERHLQRGLGT